MRFSRKDKTLKNMKKTLLLLTLMLLGISSMSAQTLIGKWMADKDFKALMKEVAAEDTDTKVDVVLHFTQSNLNLQMVIKAEDEEMSMKFEYTIPGTYTKKGKQVTAKYTPDNATFKILSLTTTDEEMQAMLKDESMKKMIYEMINEQVKIQMKDKLSEMNEFTNTFKEFTIESITANKLKLNIQNNIIGFDRTK